MYSRHDIGDDQWLRIEPLLPGRRGGHGGVAADNRRFIDAIRYLCRTGVAWRDLPHCFGNFNSIWQRYNRWCRTGVWQRIAAALGEDTEWLAVDGSCVRAAPAAAGARKKSTAPAARPGRLSAAAAAVPAARSTRR